ncbi:MULTISPECIES: hypothetical protein [unclassified Serratia (in: enterobacteria)]|uniref:hypothetical protein n=1 Tax=unclassified Serratia (in: enterobacteria) TaxID=2647522 RepID=UPI00307674D3
MQENVRVDDVEEERYRLAQNVNEQLSLILHAVGKEDAKDVIAMAAGKIQLWVQNAGEKG